MATQAPPELEAQYRAMREGCASLPAMTDVLRVTGTDAVEFLQGQVTNDVAALEPGSGCYALLLNPKGRILADMRILMLSAEELLLLTEQGESVRSKLDMYKIGRQVEIAPADLQLVHLFGPACIEAVGIEPPAGEHSVEKGEIDGVPVHVVRTYAGADLLLPHDRPPLSSERAGVVVLGEAAEVVRIESGRPRYGHDMSADNLPGELGLDESAVSFTKGCYVGQEPVARMYHRGHPNRHLRGLTLSRPVAAGESLERDGKQVGVTTSSCVSPSLGPIALALVRREVEPGEAIELPGGATATVVGLPFERRGQP